MKYTYERVVMNIRRAAVSVILLTAFSMMIPAAGQAEELDEKEKQGWLESGRKISMGGLTHRKDEIPPGRFELLMPSGGVRAILAAGDSVWVGTDGGLFIWVPGSDTILTERGSSLASVTSLMAGENGEIWVGGAAGLSVRHDWGWDRFTSRDHSFFSRITDISHGEGKIWISTWGQGCGYVVGDTLTIMTRADSLLDDRVTCVVEQSDNTIWIGTDSGVCKSDSFSWTSMRYGSRIPVGRVRDIILTEEGDLFVSVARQGVAKYSLGRVNSYGPGQGLPDREIYQFGMDAGAHVWAAGRYGLSTWDGSGWTPLRLAGISLGDHDYLSVEHDPEGNTYLGTTAGILASVARDSYRETHIPASGPESMIGLIVSSGRTMLLAGNRAIYRFDGGFTPIGLPGKWYEGTVTGMVPEQGGRLWLSTRFGILHHTGNTWEIFDRRQGLPTEHFTCAAGLDGELWFGTFDRGVLRLTSGGWVHYRSRHGLPDERISSIAADRSGTVWLTTMSGRIARFTGDEWETLDIAGTSPEQGAIVMPADSIFLDDPSVRILPSRSSEMAGSFAPVIGLDGSGRCMFCTMEGIILQSEAGWRILDIPLHRSGPRPTALKGTTDGSIWLGTDGEGAWVLKDGRWLHVDSTSGLGDDDILSIEEDPSGTVWIGTRAGGVTRYSSQH
jgi:ligand-binding sensor domain-containing protein